MAIQADRSPTALHVRGDLDNGQWPFANPMLRNFPCHSLVNFWNMKR
jgi:hypothetical protein